MAMVAKAESEREKNERDAPALQQPDNYKTHREPVDYWTALLTVIYDAASGIIKDGGGGCILVW